MALLKVKDLTYSYGDSSPFIYDALSNINLEIEKGEIIGIIGHTGSGKSTLVQHLNGLLKPTEGEILIDNKNIWENPKEIRKIRSRVGLVFQYPEYQLFEETVYRDIAFGPKNMGFEGEELDKKVRRICEVVGIRQEYLDKSPFDLSGGE
ncbi:MAG: ATP-binding cassette domain-containing protein, partial [Clostridia bacterium]|nr:ATP-binding cassette domain-containing protein [Clostridia bacterium]